MKLYLNIMILAISVLSHAAAQTLQELPWYGDFKLLGTETKAPVQTRYKLFSDHQYIYVVVEADEPDMDQLQLSRKSGSPMIWRNDSLEINFVPDGKGLVYYKLIVDANGEYTSLKLLDDNLGRETFVHMPWISLATVKATRGVGTWRVEITVPFGSMDYNMETTSLWRFNVGRNRYASGNKEFSASSRLLKSGNHSQPAHFERVTFFGFKPEKYLWDIAEVLESYSRRDNSYEFSATVNLVNRTGRFAILNLEGCLEDADGKTVATASARNKAVNDQSVRTVLSMKQVLPGCYDMTIFLKNSAGEILKLIKIPQNLVYQPIKIKILEPAYRNCLFATMPDKTIKAEIHVEESVNEPLTVTLRGAGFSREHKIIAVQPVNPVSFDMTGVPDGKYSLQVGNMETVIWKLPFQAGEVWLDKYGITHIEGEKFLPFGWFEFGPRHKTPEFNTSQIYTRSFGPVEAARKRLDDFHALGRKAVLFPYSDTSGKWQWPLFENKYRKGNLTDGQKEIIRNFVNGIKDHPAVLAYYLADEPENWDHDSAWYVQLQEFLTEIDPYHPTLMLNWGIDGIKKYYAGCDILIPDCYPNYFEDNSMEKPLWSTSQWVRTASVLRPTWLVPQVFSWKLTNEAGSKGRPPNFDELRNQIYQAFANECRGFLLYSWSDWSQMFEDTAIGSYRLGTELALLKDFLLVPNAKESIEAETLPPDPHFQVALKLSTAGSCIIAVNTSLKPIQVTFKLKSPSARQFFVAGEKRMVKIKNNSFTDTLPPLASNIYLDNEVAANAFDLQSVRQEIAVARQSRLKPGNLVGVGELQKIDYLNFREGKIPENIPTIRVSSEKTTYMTRNSGTLYFLLDGIRDLGYRPDYMAWTPRPNDSAPWVEIILPQKSEIREIRIFGTSRLKSGTVLIDDKTMENFDADEHGHAVVKIPPTQGKNVRIEVRQCNQAVGPLLTEIEVY